MANRTFYDRLAKNNVNTKLAMKGWSKVVDTKTPGQSALHFNHPLHGTVSVVQAGPAEFHVKHGGAIVGSQGVKGQFTNPHEAIAHAARYMSTLPTQKPHTNMYNNNQLGQLPQGRPGLSWGKEEATQGTFQKPQSASGDKNTYQVGVAGSPGQKFTAWAQGLVGGTSKAEAYFRSLKKADDSNVAPAGGKADLPAQTAGADAPTPTQSYNPKLERPNQRARVKQVKATLEAADETDRHKLSLSTSNSKLAKDGIASFNLPAIETCPGAGDCAKYCYADTGSFLRFWKNTMPPRVANWLASKREDFAPRMIDLIDKYKKGRDENGKPVKMNGIRIHDSGDFYSPDYIKKWTEIAKAHPDVKLYAYTKSHHPALRTHLDALHALPNVNIVQSLGSKYDQLVDPDRPHAVVFENPEQMKQAGYADAMSTDLTAADKNNTKVGLYIHGQAGGGYKGLEDHLKGNPKLSARIMQALGKKPT